MPKLALAFGPTGGHLIPAKLVADEWTARTEGDIQLFSTAPQNHVFLRPYRDRYHEIDFHPWAGRGLERLQALTDTAKVFPEIRKQLSDVDFVVGFGGYPTVPVVIAAWERGIPVFLQEQNRVVGKANHLFSQWAQLTYYGIPPLNGTRSQQSSVIGNPVRRMEPREDDWFSDDPLLVVFGGSQGAKELSSRLKQCASTLLSLDWNIYHVTGGYGETIASERGIESSSLREVEADWDLPEVIAQADCLWGRAGAGTIGEIIQYETPAILFPYPHAADNHQRENAKWVQSIGPARIGSGVNDPEDMVDLTVELAESSRSYTVPWDQTIPAEQRIVDDLLEWTAQ